MSVNSGLTCCYARLLIAYLTFVIRDVNLLQMQGLKAEMASFFDTYVESLASMRECAVQGFGTLRAEHDKLKQQISQAGNSHQAVGQ